MERIEPRYIVNYHFDDGTDEYQNEYAWILPFIGMGYLDSRGRRYRVADVWEVQEKRGALQPHGVHAFLELIEDGDDDRPGRMFPDYYGSNG